MNKRLGIYISHGALLTLNMLSRTYSDPKVHSQTDDMQIVVWRSENNNQYYRLKQGEKQKSGNTPYCLPTTTELEAESLTFESLIEQLIQSKQAMVENDETTVLIRLCCDANLGMSAGLQVSEEVKTLVRQLSTDEPLDELLLFASTDCAIEDARNHYLPSLHEVVKAAAVDRTGISSIVRVGIPHLRPYPLLESTEGPVRAICSTETLDTECSEQDNCINPLGDSPALPRKNLTVRVKPFFTEPMSAQFFQWFRPANKVCPVEAFDNDEMLVMGMDGNQP